MKILVFCSKSSGKGFDKAQPFIFEQVTELGKQGIDVELLFIEEKGIKGYIKAWIKLKKLIKKTDYELIHAHYGLTGLIATLQRKLPVIISFIGSDIHQKKVLPFSKLAMRLSSYNIFVSKNLLNLSNYNGKHCILPYGVDFSEVKPMSKEKCREELGMQINGDYCLFGSNKNRWIKNYPLAKLAISKIPGVELIDLSGNLQKEHVIKYINASDCVIMTSYDEGSPQIIKEALASNVPIVSTNVGDVKEIIGETIHCRITSYDADDIAKNVKELIENKHRTNGRQEVEWLSNTRIVGKLISIYFGVLKNYTK